MLLLWAVSVDSLSPSSTHAHVPAAAIPTRVEQCLASRSLCDSVNCYGSPLLSSDSQLLTVSMSLARVYRLSSAAFCGPVSVSVSARGLSTVSGQYSLPPLPYDYGALEPAISGQIMEAHHKKHHQTYVNNLNAAVAQLEEARHKSDPPTKLVQLQSAINFNGGGHINHSIFWTNLAPKQQGGGRHSIQPRAHCLAPHTILHALIVSVCRCVVTAAGCVEALLPLAVCSQPSTLTSVVFSLCSLR